MRESHAIVKCTLDGKPLMTMGVWDAPSDTGGARPDGTMWKAAGPFNRCTDIALAPNGDLFVSDGYANSRVHKFSPDGRLLHSWGRPGKRGPGEFHIPHGIWVHWDGRVMVCDRENNRIQLFTGDGEYLGMWTDLARPCDIFVDHDGIVYVVELDAFMTILEHGRRSAGQGRHRWGRRPRRSGPTPTGICTSATIRKGRRLVKLVRQ